MRQGQKMGIGADADITRGAQATGAVVFRNTYECECVGPDGRVKWVDGGTNIMTNEGLDEVLDKFYKGSTYTATHYVGLLDDSPTLAAADVMNSHAGWVEAVPYSDANRQTLTLGTVASQSVDNSASKASFTINATDTVGGLFLTTDNTKSGTTGNLIGEVAFSGGDKAVADGDTLNVTATLTAASA